MPEHVLTTRVEWGETDAAGIVYYPNYFRWFDKASHELLRSLGLPPRDLSQRQGILLPILSAHCDFRAPLRYDDALTVTSRIGQVKRRSFQILHTVCTGDTVTGEGHEWRAWVQQDGAGLHAVSIPEHVRRLFGSRE
ncbi:acyl-CoA thioesterase [Alicyclobacillus shizuokensis]|uniref:acyl-CoA thioesterase n=1 Tax=Alicyclobacillus shizuokensis TaxID=392014 RepID=UPI000832A9FF|nr:thioesterase family protein [Alicyclobacillus shizuokensis]MCL6627263.1 acyl-CoA thioesterase [Alicyclobacillus shizuokensis]